MAAEDAVYMATVRFRGATDTLPVVVPAGASAGAALRAAVAEWFGVPADAAPRLWLVCRGRRVADADSLRGLADADAGLVVFAGLSPAGNARPKAEGASPGGVPGLGPMADVLASHPELLASLVQLDPRLRALAEREPLVRDALRDPEALRAMLRASARPGTHAEMMRGHDRVLANVSNMPGGLALLHRVHAMVEDAGGDGGRAPDVSRLSSKYAAGVGQRSDPMPNPWGRSGRDGSRLSPLSPMHSDHSPDGVLAMLAAMGLSSPTAAQSVPQPIDNTQREGVHVALDTQDGHSSGSSGEPGIGDGRTDDTASQDTETRTRKKRQAGELPEDATDGASSENEHSPRKSGRTSRDAPSD